LSGAVRQDKEQSIVTPSHSKFSENIYKEILPATYYYMRLKKPWHLIGMIFDLEYILYIQIKREIKGEERKQRSSEDVFFAAQLAWVYGYDGN
ncbi:hypothetical protein ACJX0J_021714, partial [Zea mays]